MNKYIIPSSKFLFFPLVIAEIFLLPIVGFFLFSVIGSSGTMVLFFFWFLSLIGGLSHLSKRNTRIEISENGLIVIQSKSQINFSWNEISKISFQASIAKRVGVYEATPYLAINLTESGLAKLGSIQSSKEFGFIQKRNNFDQYMAKEKMDLYVSMKTAEEKDEGLINLLSSKSKLEKSIPPLIKTTDPMEYEKVLNN